MFTFMQEVHKYYRENVGSEITEISIFKVSIMNPVCYQITRKNTHKKKM